MDSPRKPPPLPPILQEDPGKLNCHGEQEEIWQWQINCMSREYTFEKPMPKNFGLMVGRFSDVEAKLKSQVSFHNYFNTETRGIHYNGTLYIFRNAELEYGVMQGFDIKLPIQKGAIRCVSKDMKLIRESWHHESPFIVESKIMGDQFEFHPIKPKEEFIKGER